MGRTGKLTPVAMLEPVEVDGSVISKASLNNIDYITELGLEIGQYVFIEKGGGVIPKVTGVIRGPLIPTRHSRKASIVA